MKNKGLIRKLGEAGSTLAAVVVGTALAVAPVAIPAGIAYHDYRTAPRVAGASKTTIIKKCRIISRNRIPYDLGSDGISYTLLTPDNKVLKTTEISEYSDMYKTGTPPVWAHVKIVKTPMRTPAGKTSVSTQIKLTR